MSVRVKMPARKYYCDYCDKQFQDTPADRKRHVNGIQHLQAKARWYDSFNQHHQQIPNPPLCFHFLNTVRFLTLPLLFLFQFSFLIHSLYFRVFAVTATLASTFIPLPAILHSTLQSPHQVINQSFFIFCPSVLQFVSYTKVSQT